jgi:hypothetical protein
MKAISRILGSLLLGLLLVACASQASAAPTLQFDNPYPPQAGDSSLMRGEVTIDSASINVAESRPPQITLDFAYFQPTPCYQLRVEASGPDSQGRIDITAYAVAEKDKPCTLMALATPLQASVPLGAFPGGHYTVWLNGVQVGQFDS